MISLLHCRVLTYVFSSCLDVYFSFPQSNLQGFCVSRYCSIFKIPLRLFFKVLIYYITLFSVCQEVFEIFFYFFFSLVNPVPQATCLFYHLLRHLSSLFLPFYVLHKILSNCRLLMYKSLFSLLKRQNPNKFRPAQFTDCSPK